MKNDKDKDSKLTHSVIDAALLGKAKPKQLDLAQMGGRSENPINLEQVREKLAGKQGKAYWRSLDELAETQEFQAFLQAEFPRQAAPLEASVNRRSFLKLLGASLAIAGLGACANPPINEKLVPYVKQPAEITPGKPLFFASSLVYHGYAKGVLVESHEGRPTKVEGNPDHPASLGSTDARMQAATLTLYDPDRSSAIINKGAKSSWDAFAAALSKLGKGEGLRILTETVTSPTLAAQLQAVLKKYPQAQWQQFDPAHSDSASAGAKLAFGEAVHTRYRFDKAKVIVALDADFMGPTGAANVRYTRDFSSTRQVRKPGDAMSRFYALEPTPTITGGMADHRLRVKPSQMEGAARALAAALGLKVAGTDTSAIPAETLKAMASDLQANKGAGIVVAGSEQPAIVHALAHAMNSTLGNIGETVILTDPVEIQPTDHGASLKQLVGDMNAGKVKTLLILGGNPVYTAPADLKFREALKKVPTSIHLGLYFDETSNVSTWHVPQAHDLETWGDARAFDGTVGIIQPLIAPFFGGKSAHEVLAALLGNPKQSSYEAVQAFWKVQASGDFDDFWRKIVYLGAVEGTALKAKKVSLKADFLQQAPRQKVAKGLEVIFRPDPSIGYGQSNNGWLQELPKPFSKLTWDNAVLLSPATAEQLGVTSEDLVKVSYQGRALDAPVWVFPGQADGVATLHLGYGRQHVGKDGDGVGFDAYALRTSEAPWSGVGLTLSKTGRRYSLSSTQHHHSMEGRDLIRTATLQEFDQHPNFAQEALPPKERPDLYPDYKYPSYAWGMVIDLNVCTGCNACVTACQAENNIPIVGKNQVAFGRAMHWIRVDSYYHGDLDDPELLHQPIPCMMCEKAPCEPVCPVGATVHDSEGLNVMVYNRCVGTRYCSNNCPYKVRRFNWLQYNSLSQNTESMLYNPDVTVRSRGVMEKCTYCVQRIQHAEITAQKEDR